MKTRIFTEDSSELVPRPPSIKDNSTQNIIGLLNLLDPNT